MVPHLVVLHIGGAAFGGTTHRWSHIWWCYTSDATHIVRHSALPQLSWLATFDATHIVRLSALPYLSWLATIAAAAHHRLRVLLLHIHSGWCVADAV